VPRRAVVSAAISATMSGEGYTAPYLQPSGTPARPVCGVSGLTSAREPGPAYWSAPPWWKTSTPSATAAMTKFSWVCRTKIFST
jgi:hypothetical protein